MLNYIYAFYSIEMLFKTADQQHSFEVLSVIFELEVGVFCQNLSGCFSDISALDPIHGILASRPMTCMSGMTSDMHDCMRR